MSSVNFDYALKQVLVHEGGYVDHPSDPGGATNKGITIATFRKWVNPEGTKEDLRRITDDQVAKVYRKHYWNAIKGDDLPSGLDYAVFDFAVNSGPGRAAKYLQAVVGAVQDGKIGPNTIKAANTVGVMDAINGLCDRRMKFLEALGTFPVFGRGWTKRVSDVRAKAIGLINALPITETKPLEPIQKEVKVEIEDEDPVPQPILPKQTFWQWLLSLFGVKS